MIKKWEERLLTLGPNSFKIHGHTYSLVSLGPEFVKFNKRVMLGTVRNNFISKHLLTPTPGLGLRPRTPIAFNTDA